MGDASKSAQGSGLRRAFRLADAAFGLLGVAILWPVLAFLFPGGDAPWPRSFRLDLALSLALIAAAAILFIKAARR